MYRSLSFEILTINVNKTNMGSIIAVFIQKTNYTVRLDELYVLDEEFDCMNAKTKKSVGILFRQTV